MTTKFLFALVLVAGAPIAAAEDPFQDPMCFEGGVCAGAGMCVGVICAPRGCAPVSCHGGVALDDESCSVNATIDGRTCATSVGTDLGTGGATIVAFDAGSSNGSVRDLNLPNTWLSPGIEAELNLLGVDAGSFFVYAYSSDITTEGPRGGPYGQVAPSQNHTWTQIGAVAGHRGGPTFGEETAIGIVLLDLLPEGCFARSPAGIVPEVACPSFAPLYP